MADKELAGEIARTLLSVEQIPGVELYESKMLLRNKMQNITGMAYFNPSTWRNYGESLPLQVMIERITDNEFRPAKHYPVEAEPAITLSPHEQHIIYDLVSNLRPATIPTMQEACHGFATEDWRALLALQERIEKVIG